MESFGDIRGEEILLVFCRLRRGSGERVCTKKK